MHNGVNADYPDVFQQHVEILYLLPRIVDFIPLNFRAFQRLPGSYGLIGNDSNLLIVFYVQIMPDDFVMQLHRF